MTFFNSVAMISLLLRSLLRAHQQRLLIAGFSGSIPWKNKNFKRCLGLTLKWAFKPSSEYVSALLLHHLAPDSVTIIGYMHYTPRGKSRRLPYSIDEKEEWCFSRSNNRGPRGAHKHAERNLFCFRLLWHNTTQGERLIPVHKWILPVLFPSQLVFLNPAINFLLLKQIDANSTL